MAARGTAQEPRRLQTLAALPAHVRPMAAAQCAANRNDNVEDRSATLNCNREHALTSRRELMQSSPKGERRHTVKMRQR